ncbi:hypothetical protein L596_024916 [Steinernema carpocapsae]|uniref:Uncharacterized protein n=1 Tax=Steinernema carpocapsae TaxID=34508 RepID=A0A4U5M687_STECR|nr:hypothetical protein L596_024916 [Steinernema carpocapsae]
MFEAPNQVMLRAVTSKSNRGMSASCPELSQAKSVVELSTSLPSKWAVFPTAKSQKHSGGLRKASTFADEYVLGGDGRSVIRMLFIDPQHPAFDSQYGKNNVLISVSVSNVELGINRRTLVI